MITFQITSRKEHVSPPLKKRRPISPEWAAVLRFLLTLHVAGGIFGLVVTFAHLNDAIFLLLPVLILLAVTQARNYNRHLFLNSTPRYLLCTIGLAFLYCIVVAGFELLTHPSTVLSHLILVTTTLTWAIILEPARAYFQSLIERRFNTRDQERARALEAFTSTLREEIDLVQLRERFLTVIQQTMQPYCLAFWVLTAEQRTKASAGEVYVVAEDDPLVVSLLRHPGVTEIDRLTLESPLLQEIQKDGGELIIPLASQSELIGLLVLGPHVNGEEYTREERSLLTTLTAQVAPSLRVAQMVRQQQQQVRERERIEQELRTARSIQMTFLPKEVPSLPGWQLAPYYRPAREVGGDFYDFLAFEDGYLGLTIGDVTGKGVPAALVMATVHTILRTVVQNTRSPGEVLARANELLIEEIPAGMFVTCFYALLDPRSGRLLYANAGHEVPYVRSDTCVVELLATGMPLGMLPGTSYEELEAALSPGESALFYSDGLVEAHNPGREMFGLARLRSLLAGGASETSPIDLMLGELQNFTGESWEQEDDITLLVLQRTASHA